MHELSLCRSIYSIADRAREGRPVSVIHLQVGHMRQVVPPTLEYCWGIVSGGTGLEGSRLEIDHVPVELKCLACGAPTSVENALVLVCGQCGSGEVDVVRGREFMLTSMDIGGD